MRMIGSFLGIAVLLMQIGCARTNNERLALGGSFESPTIHSTPSQSTYTEPDLFGAEPIDRSSWAPTAFVASFDGVTHDLMMRVLPPLDKDDEPRKYGRYPSVEDVLDPQSHTWSEDAWMSIAELGRSTFGSIFAVGILTWEGQLGKPQVSPMPYKRSRQDDWASGQPAPNTPKEQMDELD